MKTDIAIIGGGASGLTAAVTLGELLPRANVTILEKLDRVGKKILATGNGRCNLSNLDLSSKHYCGSIDAAKIIGTTPTAEEFFRSLGVLVTADAQGRMYPYSNSAATVLNALRLRTAELGITEECGFEMKSYERMNDGGFRIASTDDREVVCKRLIVAAGGYASQKHGTDGAVMRLLKDKGYGCARICPAVAPLRVSQDDVKGLGGVRAKGEVSAIANGKVLHTERGEIQFTSDSLSGICVFNLSRYFANYEGRLTIYADLAPDMDKVTLADYLHEIRRERRECGLDELLSGIFGSKLAVYLVKRALGRPLTDRIGTLKNGDIMHVADTVKALSFRVTGSAPWNSAQVTCGGINADALLAGLESKTERGLFLCGEILDVTGDCGGYNLQWAWSSGITAARSCAESLKGMSI